MAYEKTEWKSGDTITAEKLNNIESGVKDNENGWEVESELEIIKEEEELHLEAVSGENYSSTYFYGSFYSDEIIVTFEGIDYTLTRDNYYGTYGEFDEEEKPIFTNYPCALKYDGEDGYYFYTQNSGTYLVKISHVLETIETDLDFEKVIKKLSLKNIADSDSAGIIENFMENDASGSFSHAEGYLTTANNFCCHAEGNNTVASGWGAHAEGRDTTASGEASHAEGNMTVAKEVSSHAEGEHTIAASASHAEGIQTEAQGWVSHAEGYYTKANRAFQHVFGEYNIIDNEGTSTIKKGLYVEIVGNGTSSTRSNARTLDWQGNESLAGSITLGKGTADEVTLTAAQVKQLLALLNN